MFYIQVEDGACFTFLETPFPICQRLNHDISRYYCLYKCQPGRDLLEKCSSSTFCNCNTLESFICVCFAIIHRDQSPVLKASVSAQDIDDISHSRCVFSSHLTCTQSSHPTTKRDAPSYHPSNRAFYGPSKDNELPE